VSELLHRYKAVIFDMDGLLLDTETLWQEAEEALFAAHGGVFSREDKLRVIGLLSSYTLSEARMAHDAARAAAQAPSVTPASTTSAMTPDAAVTCLRRTVSTVEATYPVTCWPPPSRQTSSGRTFSPDVRMSASVTPCRRSAPDIAVDAVPASA